MRASAVPTVRYSSGSTPVGDVEREQVEDRGRSDHGDDGQHRQRDHGDRHDGRCRLLVALLGLLGEHRHEGRRQHAAEQQLVDRVRRVVRAVVGVGERRLADDEREDGDADQAGDAATAPCRAATTTLLLSRLLTWRCRRSRIAAARTPSTGRCCSPRRRPGAAPASWVTTSSTADPSSAVWSTPRRHLGRLADQLAEAGVQAAQSRVGLVARGAHAVERVELRLQRVPSAPGSVARSSSGLQRCRRRAGGSCRRAGRRASRSASTRRRRARPGARSRPCALAADLGRAWRRSLANRRCADCAAAT